VNQKNISWTSQGELNYLIATLLVGNKKLLFDRWFSKLFSFLLGYPDSVKEFRDVDGKRGNNDPQHSFCPYLFDFMGGLDRQA
jgi:hypothetical protein